MRIVKPGEEFTIKKGEWVGVIFYFDGKYYQRAELGVIPADVETPLEIFIGSAEEILIGLGARIEQLNFVHEPDEKHTTGRKTRSNNKRARSIPKKDLAGLYEYLGVH